MMEWKIVLFVENESAINLTIIDFGDFERKRAAVFSFDFWPNDKAEQGFNFFAVSGRKGEISKEHSQNGLDF